MTKRENKRKIDLDQQKREANQRRMERGPRVYKEVEEPKELNENIIEGRNPVIEAFETKTDAQSQKALDYGLEALLAARRNG